MNIIVIIQLVYVIAWVAAKFGISTLSVILETYEEISEHLPKLM